MNAVKALFTKQAVDLPKNMTVLSMFIMWPIMGILFGQFMPDPISIQMANFAGILIGAGPMIAISNNVAEDVEYKGLRFLVMAGVKPWQYIGGMALFFAIVTIVTLAIMAILGGFTGEILLWFCILSLFGIISSSLLGGAIGIFSKNVQQATAYSMPIMMVLAFIPIVAMFNEGIGRFAQFLFSYQIGAVLFPLVMRAYPGFTYDIPDPDYTRAVIVMVANAVILLVLFIVAYKKKGLRG
ncbi:MAG: ABC transporter permease [Oscillospiraceae bacterium]|nr:ABC transporter permease [Oscillospiraceae bacterium]